MKIVISTDSTADIPKHLCEEWGIPVLPLTIETPDGKEWLDGVTMEYTDFYKILAASDRLPSSAAVPPLSYTEHFEKCFADGVTDLIHVSLNSRGSSTYQNSVLAREMFYQDHPEAEGRFRIHLLDSLTYSMGYGLGVVEAARMAREVNEGTVSVAATAKGADNTIAKGAENAIAKGAENAIAKRADNTIAKRTDNTIAKRTDTPGRTPETADTDNTLSQSTAESTLTPADAQESTDTPTPAPAPVQRILDYLEGWIADNHVLFMPTELKFVRRSGRISGAAALIGEALGIKPVITFTKGQAETLVKARGERMGLRSMLSLAEKDRVPGSPVSIVLGSDQALNETWSKMARAAFPDATLTIPAQLGCVITINCGHRVVGLIYRRKS